MIPSLAEPTEAEALDAAGTPTSRSAIHLQGLRKAYQLGAEAVPVLKGIDLDIPEGDYVAIMGPSGSGKSTLLNMLGCLDRPTSGHFMLGGDDVALLDDDQLAAIRSSRIGFVFQAYNLIPQLTVQENIEAPLYYQGHITPESRDRCRKMAELVGLGHRLGHRPPELSGGQQQRAGIARSLSNDPRYILADEPTGNLDSVTTREILDLLDRLNADGKTIVLVTHEEDVAMHARRIVRLFDGNIQSDVRHRPLPEQVSQMSPPPAPQHDWSSSLRLMLRTAQLGVKSLLLHPLRSLLTILGIFIGVASVIWLLAIGEGISDKAQQQIAELGAKNIILTTSIPPPQQGAIRRAYGITQSDFETLTSTVPSITKAIPMRELPRRYFAYGTKQAYGRLVGCTPEYLELNRMQIARGHFITHVELQQNAKICVIATELAEELFGFADPIGRAIHVGTDYFQVVGVMKPRAAVEAIAGARAKQEFNRDVYIPMSTMWALFHDFYARTENGIPIASQVTLELRDQKEVLDTAEIVRRTLAKTHDREDYTIAVPLELLEQAKNTRIMFIAMMGLVAAISLVVGGIGIMNIMLATVTERTREIGIRRAIGARRQDITQQFLVETVVLSVTGGITGMIGGLACTPIFMLIMKSLLTAFPKAMAALPEVVRTMVPIVVPWSLPLAFGISVAIGVLFGLYPARRAAMMNPIEALRHVA